MKKLLRWTIPAALMIAAASPAFAGKPSSLVETNQTWKLGSQGSFSQAFRFTTGSDYLPTQGRIYAAGPNSDFKDLSIDIYALSGEDLTHSILATVTAGNRIASFIDSDVTAVDLKPLVTYKLVVSGMTKKNDAAFGIKGSMVTSISPVPEPESYAMFLAGLGLVGAIAFRRARPS